MQQLDRARAAELQAMPFTYPEVGATPDPQPDYLSITRSRTLAARHLESAAEALLTWQVHERAGLSVTGVVDEPTRRGFAYGTLPGHPEAGEELFLLERRDDGSVTFTVTAFSRPATRLARAGGPLSRLVQRRMTDRYLRAL